MARNKGLASFSANFEPQMAAPLDARANIATKAELYLPATWLANDGSQYTYVGMLVSVSADGANNGLYLLVAADYTLPASWGYIGSGAVVTPKTSVLDITGNILAGAVFDVTASGVNYTWSGDAGNLGASAAVFNATATIMVFYGIMQHKGVDVIWDSATTFHFSSDILDSGDKLVIIS